MSPEHTGVTYPDPRDPQRFWGELAKCFTVADLNALPAGTQVWGTTVGKDGWGSPYSAQGDGQFWDWGNDYMVGAEDISTPAYALPAHPMAGEDPQDGAWADAQARREQEAVQDSQEVRERLAAHLAGLDPTAAHPLDTWVAALEAADAVLAVIAGHDPKEGPWPRP